MVEMIDGIETIKKGFMLRKKHLNGMSYEALNRFYGSFNVKIEPDIAGEVGVYDGCVLEIEGQQRDVYHVAKCMRAVPVS